MLPEMFEENTLCVTLFYFMKLLYTNYMEKCTTVVIKMRKYTVLSLQTKNDKCIEFTLILKSYLEVSSLSLFNFNGFKESLEIASSKSLMVVSLNDFNENCGTILNRLAEDLQQISVVIVVNQNFQFLQNVQVLFYLDLKIKKYSKVTQNF